MLIGLVGKPSVGKSTFFKAATLAEVEIASYPFTTIKANHGVGYVKVDCIEKEFHTKCNPNKGFCINQNRFVPIDLMDVAGLVPGASEGKGLGNQFLNDLRDANAFIHIVDSSGTTDTEGKPTNWSDEDLMTFSARLREVSKPMILAANKCDSEKSKENIEKMRKTFPNILIYPCSADSELALRQAAKAEIIEYIPGENHFKIKKELNPKQSEALNRIQEDVLNVYGGTGVQEILNKVVFDLLDYLAIFPASANKLGDSKGNILPDCFLLKNGSTALDFAYYLHTDFGKNFIKAIDAKTKQIKGKEYKLKNRDALEIITR